ncbi:MAG: ubiquinol-cytochrome c reductase iron-sulfur subunit [Acidimicrobiales bacterium]|nr:ubiquinol-cytochrome c reductase iron-sulfur subunit [Acidimicrobiales bacterium]
MEALAVAIPILVVFALIVLFAAMRRRDTDEAIGTLSRETKQRDKAGRKAAPAESAEAEAVPATGREVERAAVVTRRGSDVVLAGQDAPVVPFVAPDPETFGATRRAFLNRSITGWFAFGLSGFGAASIAFLWPGKVEGFGSKIKVGLVNDVKSEIRSNQGFLYRADGRMWVTEYPVGAIDAARGVYSQAELNGMEAGLVALYQKCPHLGCRVPECNTSQWFECPCHGSQYNRVGEKRGGPAPRGMDRFATSIEGGSLVVDTGTIIQGPPIGTNTTKQEAEGPNCISGGGEHS